jgi:hypothetical protein
MFANLSRVLATRTTRSRIRGTISLFNDKVMHILWSENASMEGEGLDSLQRAASAKMRYVQKARRSQETMVSGESLGKPFQSLSM